MRIVVNDIAASSGGAMTVLKDFYQCVKDNDTENEWIFLLGDNYLEETENIKVITLPEIKKSGFKKLMFDLFTGKKFIKSLEPDVVFSMQNIITFGLKVPQVLYIHQALPFQKVKSFSLFKSNERSIAVKQHIVGALIKKSAKAAQKVIVQTDWMKEAVMSMCKIPEQRIEKAAPAVKNISQFAKGEEFRKERFFYPTASGIYKNNGLVYKASAVLEEKGTEHSIIMTLPQEKSAGRVKCIGRIPYEDVIAEYNRSTLIFPSYIETFGYPLAEARQLGCIVLAADTPFAREVLKDYENAYFFDYNDASRLAELMEQVATGEISRKESRESFNSAENGWYKILKLVCSAK